MSYHMLQPLKIFIYTLKVTSELVSIHILVASFSIQLNINFCFYKIISSKCCQSIINIMVSNCV